uniref:Uncharacterized protein n=1 Tax=Oryza rufipogon TaxID=4529 RepID=A0A0E0NWH7_ORYRU
MARYKWQKELRGEVSNVTTAHGPLKLEEKPLPLLPIKLIYGRSYLHSCGPVLSLHCYNNSCTKLIAEGKREMGIGTWRHNEEPSLPPLVVCPQCVVLPLEEKGWVSTCTPYYR